MVPSTTRKFDFAPRRNRLATRIKMPEPQINELKEALRDALERRGTLPALRAQIRRDVFSAMEDGGDVRHPTPPENIVINELIREYLAFNSALIMNTK